MKRKRKEKKESAKAPYFNLIAKLGHSINSPISYFTEPYSMQEKIKKKQISDLLLQWKSKAVHSTGATELYEDLDTLRKLSDFVIMSYSHQYKYNWGTGVTDKGLFKKMEQLDNRTLRHSSKLEMLEADVDVLKESERASVDEEVMPQYLSEDFERLRDHIENLESAGENKPKILYYLMEAEVVLGELEEKAQCTGRKYEARLSATLRDICRLHEPSDISEEQINVFATSNRALMDGWSKLNREKLAWIRSELLKVNLTWLPVTDKAAKEVSNAQSMTE